MASFRRPNTNNSQFSITSIVIKKFASDEDVPLAVSYLLLPSLLIYTSIWNVLFAGDKNQRLWKNSVE